MEAAGVPFRSPGFRHGLLDFEAQGVRSFGRSVLVVARVNKVTTILKDHDEPSEIDHLHHLENVSKPGRTTRAQRGFIEPTAAESSRGRVATT